MFPSKGMHLFRCCGQKCRRLRVGLHITPYDDIRINSVRITRSGKLTLTDSFEMA